MKNELKGCPVIPIKTCLSHSKTKITLYSQKTSMRLHVLDNGQAMATTYLDDNA